MTLCAWSIVLVHYGVVVDKPCRDQSELVSEPLEDGPGRRLARGKAVQVEHIRLTLV